MPKFRDIPQFPKAHYETTVLWRYIEDTLKSWSDTSEGMGGLNLDPPYQREHVWTREQQIAFVEYQLQGGETGRHIIFNSPDWQGSWKRATELVDGKQRLEAVRAFIRGEFPAFGHYFAEFEDKLPSDLYFSFRVCTLDDPEKILQLYLNINAGGTPHTAEELERVRGILEAVRASKKTKKVKKAT